MEIVLKIFEMSTLFCLIVGGSQIANFGKKPSSSFNYYKRMT